MRKPVARAAPLLAAILTDWRYRCADLWTRLLSNLLITTALASGPASADITSTVGLTQMMTAPSKVTGDFAANGGLPSQLIFAEQKSVTLATPLVTDTGTIAAGVTVDSYWFAVNSFTLATVDTSVTFNVPVLGIIYQRPRRSLRQSVSAVLSVVHCQ